MTRTRLGSWLMYAAAGLALTLLVALVALQFVAPSAGRAVWVAAAAGYLLQLISFALVVAMRDNAQLFMTAWLTGLMLRFAVLIAGAFLLPDTGLLPRAATLLSYVGFVFVLLLLEPWFLRWDLRRQ